MENSLKKGSISAKDLDKMHDMLMKARLETKKCVDCGEEFQAPPDVTDCAICCLSKILEFKND